MNDCMWQIIVDAEEVCIPAEPTPDGKLARCACIPGCGYTKRITADEYRNAPRFAQESEQTL